MPLSGSRLHHIDLLTPSAMEGRGSAIFSFKVQFLKCDGFGNRGWMTQKPWLGIPLPG
jgi:hypothetical protein